MSEEVKVVDGSCDPKTYALIASNKSAELAVRPFLTKRPALNRSGNQTGETAIALWFRVHLQNPGFPGDVDVLTPRVAKNWGIPLYVTSKYWRNDVYLQVALEERADPKYLRNKVKAGIDTVLEALVENIGPKHKLCNKEATVDWLTEQLAPAIESFGNKSKGKNKAALLSKPVFKHEEAI